MLRVVACVAIAGVLGTGIVWAVLASQLSDERSAREGLENKLQVRETRIGNTDARVAVIEPQVAKRAAADTAAESERRALQAQPSKYLDCESVKIARRGIVNDYSRVTKATVRNTSAYSVSDLRGEVEYRAKGVLLGTVPATAAGTVLAGQSVTLTVDAKEITARADEAETVFVAKTVSILGVR